MRNSGFFKVFSFAYAQTLKAKSTRITMIVLCVISLLVFPVMSIASGALKDDEEKIIKIDKLHINCADEELQSIIIKHMNEIYGSTIEIVNVTDHEAQVDNMKKSKDDVVYLYVQSNMDITASDFGIVYTVIFDKGDEAKDIAHSVSNVLSSCAEDITLEYGKVTDEQMELIAESHYEIINYNSDGEVIDDTESEEDKGALSMVEYWFAYAWLMVFIFIISFAGSMSAEGIVAEKANRVIEYVMVNLKPMELIIGKVCSGMASLLTIFGAAVASLFASSVINVMVFDSEADTLFDVLGKYCSKEALPGFSIGAVVISMLIAVGGLYLYGILGGLCGGLVSKVEEMGEGLKTYTIVELIGAYTAMGVLMMSTSSTSGVFVDVVALLPISSVFITPSLLLTGKTSMLMALGSLGLIIVLGVLLTLLASKIFGQLLYLNGAPLKIKDVISLAKSGKKK